jgi:hypothetical protein
MSVNVSNNRCRKLRYYKMLRITIALGTRHLLLLITSTVIAMENSSNYVKLARTMTGLNKARENRKGNQVCSITWTERALIVIQWNLHIETILTLQIWYNSTIRQGTIRLFLYFTFWVKFYNYKQMKGC